MTGSVRSAFPEGGTATTPAGTEASCRTCAVWTAPPGRLANSRLRKNPAFAYLLKPLAKAVHTDAVPHCTNVDHEQEPAAPTPPTVALPPCHRHRRHQHRHKATPVCHDRN